MSAQFYSIHAFMCSTASSINTIRSGLRRIRGCSSIHMAYTKLGLSDLLRSEDKDIQSQKFSDLL